MEKKIINWLANGERGSSSEAIAFQMLGQKQNDSRGWCHPHDPADFKRCLKLIFAVPEIRPRLHEMRQHSIYWNALIERWDEVERCFLREVGEWLSNEYSTKRANETYALMERIYKQAEKDGAKTTA